MQQRISQMCNILLLRIFVYITKIYTEMQKYRNNNNLTEGRLARTRALWIYGHVHLHFYSELHKPRGYSHVQAVLKVAYTYTLLVK